MQHRQMLMRFNYACEKKVLSHSLSLALALWSLVSAMSAVCFKVEKYLIKGATSKSDYVLGVNEIALKCPPRKSINMSFKMHISRQDRFCHLINVN